MAAVYDVNRDRAKRKEPFTALDFFRPRAQRTPATPQLSDEDAAKNRARNMTAIVEMWNAALGGEDLRDPIRPESP